jgi:hypothetical protein
MREFRADAIVEPDTARHLLYISTDFFRQIRDLIDEGDLGGKERAAIATLRTSPGRSSSHFRLSVSRQVKSLAI